MRCAAANIVQKVGFLSAIILLLLSCFDEGISAMLDDHEISLEAANVQLTIHIPDNEIANSASYILIRLDRGTGHDQIEVIFLMKDGPSVTDLFKDRLTVTLTNRRRVDMLLRNVSALDAGMFRCFSSSSKTIIPNCGQLLIVIRKPDPPTVKVLPSSTAVVGSSLHLVCQTHTRSLPSGHGLTSQLYWYDESGTYLDPYLTDNQRIHINEDNQLVIEQLRRADSSLKVYCTSADNTGDVTTRIVSEPSTIFQVMPEYGPTVQDIQSTPEFEIDHVVHKSIGQSISYRCQAQCVPSCQIMWMYRPYGGAAGFGEVMNLVKKNVLVLDVSRTNEGSYRCYAENNHATVYKGFYLEALYINNPFVEINGLVRSNARFVEGDTSVNLSCDFDSNPGPLVVWSSPLKTILSSSQRAVGPQEKLTSNGIHLRSYSSHYSLTSVQCEDSGVYRCVGSNNISIGEGRIHIIIMCSPSSADIPGLKLLSDYVWDIPHALSIDFIIRALPEPDIARIMSGVKGQSRKEEIPKDFVISKIQNYDGKSYLTKFTLTSRRNLDMTDADRMFIMTIESSEFTKDFSFRIRPRGAPREIFNLTATDINHDSLSLSWMPGFNGGETQTFAVEFRIQNQPGHQDEPHQLTEEQAWILVANNLTDFPIGQLIKVQIVSLRSNTEYVVRITASNKLGTSVREITITTTDPPEETLGVGAIIGIIVCVLVILAVVAVVIYFFVYKKGRGKHEDEDDDDSDEVGTQEVMAPKQQQTVSLLDQGDIQHLKETIDEEIQTIT
uniref:Uncharacterized protein n=1 Tax=Arion vulgaris TaxID=1028688 RepID=A0A0B6ZTE4_9EUPU